MSKGTILNIGRRTATLMTEDLRMVKVRYQPGMTRGQEYSLNKAQTFPANPIRRLAPVLVAVCLVLLITAGILYSGLLAEPVYATLSVDVNPSVEFSLNRDLEVIKVRAINEDAARLLVSEDYIGLNWQEALRQWTQVLKAQNTIQVQNMLIAACLPDDAAQLKQEMVSLENQAVEGDLQGIAVTVIYSSDQAVTRTATQNQLSVGRQMLLNQAAAKGENLNAEEIAQAGLGELVGQLLEKGDHDQTRLTIRATESLSDSTGTGEPSQQTNRETSGSQSGSMSTNRETNRETSGSQSGSMQTSRETARETSGSQSGSMQTSRETARETSQMTNQATSQIQEPSGSNITSGSQAGSQAGPGGN